MHKDETCKYVYDYCHIMFNSSWRAAFIRDAGIHRACHIVHEASTEAASGVFVGPVTRAISTEICEISRLK